MNAFIQELLTSKKVVATVSAIVTVIAVKVAGKLGVVIDTDAANQITMLVGVLASAYLVAQGVADHGAVAAQITADAKMAAVAIAPILVQDGTRVLSTTEIQDAGIVIPPRKDPQV